LVTSFRPSRLRHRSAQLQSAVRSRWFPTCALSRGKIMNAGEKSESSGNPLCELLPHSVACVPDIVPKSDCRIGKVMFIAESAKACYVQHKKFPDELFATEP